MLTENTCNGPGPPLGTSSSISPQLGAQSCSIELDTCHEDGSWELRQIRSSSDPFSLGRAMPVPICLKAVLNGPTPTSRSVPGLQELSEDDCSSFKTCAAGTHGDSVSHKGYTYPALAILDEPVKIWVEPIVDRAGIDKGYSQHLSFARPHNVNVNLTMTYLSCPTGDGHQKYVKDSDESFPAKRWDLRPTSDPLGYISIVTKHVTPSVIQAPTIQASNSFSLYPSSHTCMCAQSSPPSCDPSRLGGGSEARHDTGGAIGGAHVTRVDMTGNKQCQIIQEDGYAKLMNWSSETFTLFGLGLLMVSP